MWNAIKGASKGTIIRTAVLVLALANTSLQLAGFDVLPFNEADVELGITMVLNVGAAIAVWWKNNSFSREAQEADEIMERKKAVNKRK